MNACPALPRSFLSAALVSRLLSSSYSLRFLLPLPSSLPPGVLFSCSSSSTLLMWRSSRDFPCLLSLLLLMPWRLRALIPSPGPIGSLACYSLAGTRLFNASMPAMFPVVCPFPPSLTSPSWSLAPPPALASTLPGNTHNSLGITLFLSIQPSSFLLALQSSGSLRSPCGFRRSQHQCCQWPHISVADQSTSWPTAPPVRGTIWYFSSTSSTSGWHLVHACSHPNRILTSNTSSMLPLEISVSSFKSPYIILKCRWWSWTVFLYNLSAHLVKLGRLENYRWTY